MVLVNRTNDDRRCESFAVETVVEKRAKIDRKLIKFGI